MTAHDVSRRELFKRVGVYGAAIVAMPELSRVLTFRRELFAQTPAPVLAGLEKATVAAICARMIPTDDNGPGATEAHAADYIDRALGGALADTRPEYTLGLAALERAAQQQFGDTFAKLASPQQDTLLTEIQNTPFFSLVRGHTLQGTFCDPIYGGNANFVGWDLIGYPGVRLNVTAAEQNMSTPPSRNHKSAYDYLMFSKTETMNGH